jgi:hypothetical protein
MSRGTTKRLRSQGSRFGSSVSSGERSSVFPPNSLIAVTTIRLIAGSSSPFVKTGSRHLDAAVSPAPPTSPTGPPTRRRKPIWRSGVSRNHRFNSSRECTPCTKRLFAGVISAETSLGTGSWALLRRNSQARQAAEKSQTAEKQPPGLKPGIYRSVLAGLKTRYPGLKSGAGTD